ncbi:apicomplexan specific protein [Babesia ovis]|uniref:Apicomplexan specific protein n=1 Tax=Babesia ovis TaxID=5869 RepID=A0A9W5TB56_BABOV|nr:apicomplexan specific protein [Babesia ovis]
MVDDTGVSVARDDIVKALREIIKSENLKSSNLPSIREALSRRFYKSESYFANRKEEINELIVDVLKKMHNEGHLMMTIKSETTLAPLDVEPDSNVMADEERHGTPDATTELFTSRSEENDETGPPSKKTKLLQGTMMTKGKFLESAPQIKVQIENSIFNAPPRTFSTGSCGWNLNEKIKIEVDGKTLICQVGLNCTVVGSKSWNP